MRHIYLKNIKWINAITDLFRPKTENAIDWFRCIPFILLHLMCLGVFFVGISWPAIIVLLITYSFRVFALTGFYHRYFSHRTFKTSRLFQFVMAFIGCTSVQRGPVWWAAHHRHHHIHSDKDDDIHSPHRIGFLRSHMGWFMTRKGFQTQSKYINDWQKYPELIWLDKFNMIPPLILGIFIYNLGVYLNINYPELGTSGLQMLIWGFIVSTILVYHVTYSINSIAHKLGSRRYNTKDHSRNNLILALLTFGEGWHNNHHHYPSSARQGFFWWEIDFTYYILKLFSYVGLIWDIRDVPDRARHDQQINTSDKTGGD